MRLLTVKYWFQLIPIYNGATLKILFIAFLGLMIIGALIRMLSKRRLKEKLQIETARKIATLLVTMGLMGLWYWFVALEQIPFLSERFWLIAWAITALAWAISITRFIKKKAPEEENIREKKEQDKYFQKKRKK